MLGRRSIGKGTSTTRSCFIVTPPTLPGAHVQAPYENLAGPYLPNHNTQELAWQFVVTRRGATSVYSAERDTMRSGAARHGAGLAVDRLEVGTGRRRSMRRQRRRLRRRERSGRPVRLVLRQASRREPASSCSVSEWRRRTAAKPRPPSRSRAGRPTKNASIETWRRRYPAAMNPNGPGHRRDRHHRVTTFGRSSAGVRTSEEPDDRRVDERHEEPEGGDDHDGDRPRRRRREEEQRQRHQRRSRPPRASGAAPSASPAVRRSRRREPRCRSRRRGSRAREPLWS